VSRTHRFLLWLGFVFHTLLSVHEIARPFLLGHVGWAGAMRGIIARNYLDIGWMASKLLPHKAMYPIDVFDVGPIHWNHPPTVNIITGLSFELFGQSEWAAQLVPVLMAIGCYWIWYALGRKISPLAGLTAAWLFVFTPMQMEYGRLINYEVPILFFSLLALVFFARKTRRDDQIGVSLMVLAVCIDWSGCFIAAAMGLSLLIDRRWKAFLALGLATSTTAAALFLWLNTVADGGLITLGKRRATGTTLSQVWDITSGRFIDFFGWPLLILALVGLVWQLKKARAGERVFRIHPVSVTFIVGPLIYFMVFKNAAYVHVFYSLLFMPAIIMSATLGLLAITRGLDWLDPRGQSIAVALGVMVFLGGVYSNAETLHLRTFSISVERSPKRNPPYESRFNEYLVTKWLHDHSGRTDVIAAHYSVNFTIQGRYYLHRDLSRVGRLTTTGARYLVFAERRLTSVQRIKMDREHRTIRFAGYFIVDFEGDAKDDIILNYVAQPPTLTHMFFVSRIFPPYRLEQKSLAAPSKLK
jgi:hypothetical protein